MLPAAHLNPTFRSMYDDSVRARGFFDVRLFRAPEAVRLAPEMW